MTLLCNVNIRTLHKVDGSLYAHSISKHQSLRVNPFVSNAPFLYPGRESVRWERMG